MQVARFQERATMSHCYEKNPAVKYKRLVNLDLHPPWVVKSSQLPAKIAAYLISIGRLLCLAFLYRWCDIPGLAAYFDNSAIYFKTF